MDPDIALAQYRNCMREARELEAKQGDQKVIDRLRSNAAAAMEGLDTWLTAGGFLPKEWQP